VKTGRLTTRFLGGRALRFQPDGRLVSLVRDGYESAFEEIFRRYGAALRHAPRSSPPLSGPMTSPKRPSRGILALRGSDKEIQLAPWLYRIVRNTALTNIGTSRSPRSSSTARAACRRELAEQREAIGRLLGGLRDFAQAAIVMRELEGLSHEQIAAPSA
jgi:hypothetical protein